MNETELILKWLLEDDNDEEEWKRKTRSANLNEKQMKAAEPTIQYSSSELYNLAIPAVQHRGHHFNVLRQVPDDTIEIDETGGFVTPENIFNMPELGLSEIRPLNIPPSTVRPLVRTVFQIDPDLYEGRDDDTF